MKILIPLLLLGSPAAAWDFTPGQPCILRHATETSRIELTYDPTLPLYSITFERDAPWPDSGIFAIQFLGPNGLTISTDQHIISQDGLSLTVRDRGFGNVLNGMQFNQNMRAILGETSVTASLDGAAEPVEDFRLCRPVAGV